MAPKPDPTGSKKPIPVAGTQGARPSTPVGASTTADGKRKASQSPPAAGGPTAQASRPARPAAADRINNLRITVKEGNKEVRIENGKSVRYNHTEEIVRKALRVLESTEGNGSLANMTAALLDNYTKRKTPTTWGARPQTIPALKIEMAAFVKRLRDNFPEIKIQSAPAGDAYTNRYEPIGDTDAVDFAKFDMERVEMILPADIIANIMKAEEKDLPITHHMFHMILTVCHEVIHMLVCALSAEKRPVTPPDMAVKGHTQGLGESGWWWEIKFLGGIVKMYQDKTDPAAATLTTRQSGLPLLATGNSTTSTFQRIDPAYIADFVKDSPPAGFKRFPIRCTNDPAMSSADVKKMYGGPMSTARAKNRVIKNPSENNSPERKLPKAPKLEASASTESGTRASTRGQAAAGKPKAPDATMPLRPK